MGEHASPHFRGFRRVFKLKAKIASLLLFFMMFQAFQAWAGLRTIPAEALAAAMQATGQAQVVLGKKVVPLSPAAQIRDADNRLVLPAYLNGTYKVRVLLDAQGQLHRAWILTPEESALPAPKF